MEQPIDFFNIFLYLKEKGFSRILIESGLTFLNYLTTNKFINNLFIFQSNIKLKSNGSGVLKKNLIKKMIQKNKVKINLFDNNLYKVDFKNV